MCGQEQEQKKTHRAKGPQESWGFRGLAKQRLMWSHKQVTSKVEQMGMAGTCAWAQSVAVLSVLQRMCSGWSKGQPGLLQATEQESVSEASMQSL